MTYSTASGCTSAQGNSGHIAVCQAESAQMPAAAPAAAAPEANAPYQYRGLGARTCPTGYRVVVTKAGCRLAMNALDAGTANDEIDNGTWSPGVVPSGCFKAGMNSRGVQGWPHAGWHFNARFVYWTRGWYVPNPVYWHRPHSGYNQQHYRVCKQAEDYYVATTLQKAESDKPEYITEAEAQDQCSARTDCVGYWQVNVVSTGTQMCSVSISTCLPGKFKLLIPGDRTWRASQYPVPVLPNWSVRLVKQKVPIKKSTGITYVAGGA
jgi:hypothetical protein